jgi:hypothetical protein
MLHVFPVLAGVTLAVVFTLLLASISIVRYVAMITVGKGWIKVQLEFLVLFDSSVQDLNVCVAIIIV